MNDSVYWLSNDHPIGSHSQPLTVVHVQWDPGCLGGPKIWGWWSHCSQVAVARFAKTGRVGFTRQKKSGSKGNCGDGFQGRLYPWWILAVQSVVCEDIILKLLQNFDATVAHDLWYNTTQVVKKTWKNPEKPWWWVNAWQQNPVKPVVWWLQLFEVAFDGHGGCGSLCDDWFT